MGLQTIFANGPLAVTVKYGSGVLYAGVMGLSSNESFPDANPDYQATLTIDGSGVVTLSSPAENWTGGEYSVDFAMPSGGSSASLSGCSVPEHESPDLFARADGADTAMTGTSYAFPSVPVETIGFGATPGGA